ncbi:acyl-CoA dehydrogenase [Rhizobium sp. CFBP 8752]|uniref:acyl-CoA dehydrogenase n=1 Tax=Rhizobium sp. CFBP 8752 TaxID=2775301 RepID=UPI001780C8E2|nr:acyl-CoA dehydrogenase [Rhizobium sp. CFBP 8752]MBD8664235.1 acyl-CoA dehydrogenase [Rhizobium sp. CFBP 8752]
MSYIAPVEDIMFTLNEVAGLDRAITKGLYVDISTDLVAQVLEEAGRFANEKIAPINRQGDEVGVRLESDNVAMPPGWKTIYQAWTEAGWNGLSCDPDFGGQGLPHLVQAACTEIWNSASMAFALGPLLTSGAVEAIAAHGSSTLKQQYLVNLVSGAWMGTMNLTEAHAGSDLSTIRTRAEPQGDGTYRVTGQKIFITYGEHDLTDNIIHLVLARLPGAPVGTRGISLFLVPKILPDGARNDVHCGGLEHKLGIHASPTCTMNFGDKGGATGWLIGEENCGLACMFTMMNNARLAMGLQGVGIAERAFQKALGFARERRQGRVAGSMTAATIIEHPDIRRMLLVMKSKIHAARGICYLTAAAIDAGHLASDDEAKRRASEKASLLTPVAKAYGSDIGCEVASLGLQVHGGMGFIEETGAAQHMRDARIAPIYEGTNGIQAIDLVMRKLSLSGGEAVAGIITEIRLNASALAASNSTDLVTIGLGLQDACLTFEETTNFLLLAAASKATDDALSGATAYLTMFGHTLGLSTLGTSALAAHAEIRRGADPARHQGRIALARFFADQIAVEVDGLGRAIVTASDAQQGAEFALAS